MSMHNEEAERFSYRFNKSCVHDPYLVFVPLHFELLGDFRRLACQPRPLLVHGLLGVLQLRDAGGVRAGRRLVRAQQRLLASCSLRRRRGLQMSID